MRCGVVHVHVCIVSHPLHPDRLSTQDNHLATIGSLRAQIKTLKSDAKRNQDRIQTLETDLANASGDSSEKDSSQDDLERIGELEIE